MKADGETPGTADGQPSTRTLSVPADVGLDLQGLDHADMWGYALARPGGLQVGATRREDQEVYWWRVGKGEE